jgi:excisionase family DNA binding protein
MARKQVKVRLEPIAYGIAELAAMACVSSDTIRDQIACRALEHVRVGHRVLITRRQADEWLARLETRKAADAAAVG